MTTTRRHRDGRLPVLRRALRIRSQNARARKAEEAPGEHHRPGRVWTAPCCARPAPSSDFDLNPETPLPDDRILRPAGVLVAIWDRPGGPDLILTKRSSHLKHHPGQIAFPGGKVDPEDDGPIGAALREIVEESWTAPEPRPDSWHLADRTKR